jgi:hypothetical protein
MVESRLDLVPKKTSKSGTSAQGAVKMGDQEKPAVAVARAAAEKLSSGQPSGPSPVGISSIQHIGEHGDGERSSGAAV